MSRVLALLASFVVLAGCRLQITVPQGGYVSSSSGSYYCGEGETCVIDVSDFEFSEDFVAEPEPGWVFLGWKEGRGRFCSRQHGTCHLTTTGLDAVEALASIVASDETFYLEPEFVPGTPIETALTGIEDERLQRCLRDWISRNEEGPLQYAEELRGVDCAAVGSIGGIEAFSSLEQLKLHYVSIDTLDLDRLAGLKWLKHLAIEARENGSSINISPLPELTRLRYLSITGYPITNLSPVASLPQLVYLKLDNNGLEDITPLAGLSLLKTLSLATNRIGDIAPLTGLTKLNLLTLSNNLITDIGPLAGLAQLGLLQLDNNQVSETGALAGLKKLQSLRLEKNRIQDIRPLAGLSELRSLYLANNRISDISPLVDLTQLYALTLSNNRIADISPLAEMKLPDRLELSYNQISDLSPLAELEEPLRINLSHNRITDLSPLAGFTTFGTVDLSSNQIRDISPLASLREVWLLDLSQNQISTVGHTFDGISTTIYVNLTGNPLSCSEIEHLLTEVDYRVFYVPVPENC